MTRKMSKRLVIDASVARSAGETDHPLSSACRLTLATVLKVCHRVVMCQQIRKEWAKHQSRYASGWLAAMQSRGKIVRVEIPEEGTLPVLLKSLDVGSKGLKTMQKDLHLVAASLLTDHRIISSDEAARSLFRTASEQIEELRQIHWVNPIIEEDQCIEWLKAGAKT